MGRTARKQPKRKDIVSTQQDAADAAGVALSTYTKHCRNHPKEAPKFDRKLGGYRLPDVLGFVAKHNVIARAKTPELEEEREVRLRRAKLALAREEFEFEQLKERLVPISQVDLLFSRTLSAFKAAILALPARINERLEGLDYNDRLIAFNEEVAIILRTLVKPDYLHPIEENDDELLE